MGDTKPEILEFQPPCPDGLHDFQLDNICSRCHWSRKNLTKLAKGGLKLQQGITMRLPKRDLFGHRKDGG